MKVALLYDAPAAHLGRLTQAAPHAEFVRGNSSAAAARHAVRGAAAVLGNWYFAEAMHGQDQSSLRFVQTNSVGVDRHLPVLSNPATVLCNARGLYDAEMADHTLALALACVRELPVFRDQQAQRLWQRRPLATLRDMQVLVLGGGGVGRSVASRLSACDARVRVARRGDDWRAWLSTTQLLVVCLPLTPITRGAVGAAELNALARGASIVNTSRGAILDHAALLVALQRDHLAFAALDVFVEEPLPPSSPLWNEPRCLITPHVARSVEQGEPRWLRLFEDNFVRFVTGQSLHHIVDRAAGY